MKITCHSCQAKYTIADEKVAGKTVKIKCKKCSATIVVHGDQQQQQSAQTLDPNLVLGAGAGEEDVETRVFNGEAGGAPGGDEWTVNVTDDDQRTMTTAQIVIEWQQGALNADTYVWKDGMGDWLPITSVPELMQLVGGGPAAVAAEPQFGLGGTMMMDPAAASASRGPAAPAAKRAGGRAGAVDLFGAQPEPAASQAPPPGADRLVGERNENSVLFSLSALTATENAARAQGPGPSLGGASSRAPSPPRPGQNGGRAGLDDIMNMTGGLSAAPMLAPPPLLAPVIEAPPPPPVMMQQPMMQPGQAAYGMPMSQPMPQPKSKAGLIIGIVLGVVVLGGVGAFFATRSSTPDATATNDQGSATAAATAAPPAQQSAAPTAAPTAEASNGAAAADTGAPSSAPSADAKTADNRDTGHGHVGGPMPGKDKDAKKEEKVADKKEEKAPEKAPDKPEKKEEPAAGGGGEFNRGAATSALGAAAGAARGCAKPDGPTGGGRVKVTFAPSGRVTSASIEGPPFAGTAVGGCIAAAFRGAHIPPFEGSPVSVTKSFSVN